MNAQQIRARLRELDFYIVSVSDIDHGQKIRLGCGAVVNVYNKGTILVQGKFIASCREESLTMLKEVLPSDTKWCIK